VLCSVHQPHREYLMGGEMLEIAEKYFGDMA